MLAMVRRTISAFVQKELTVSNLANIATIAAALIAVAALSLQYVQARRAHKQAWLRMLKTAGFYALIGIALVFSFAVTAVSGLGIYEFVTGEGVATRGEIFWLIVKFINLGFYSVASVSLLTACVLIVRRARASAQGDDAEATPAQ